MWFKHGLKLQKLLAQGIPWVSRGCPSAPCKGKSLEYMLLYNQFYWDLQETISLLNHLPTFRNQL